MPFECWIEPEPAAARLADLLRRLNWDGELSTALAGANVKRIELAGPAQEWRIVIDRPGEAPGALAEALAAHAPVLRLVPERPAPAPRPAPASAPILRTDGALAEAPAVAEAPPAADEDDPDGYMQAIMQRARDFLERGEAEAGAPKSAERLLLGREISGRTIALRDLQEEERSVSICAEVMSCEVTELRSGRRLISCDVTDYTDSLSLKLFEETDGQLGGKIKVGQWIRARGPVQHDRYTQELVLMPNDLMVVPPPSPRLDTAETKRVELHLHTKMSALDGAVDIDRLIAQAAQWGHDAVAITDHGVVQAFPEAYAAAKRAKIKLIYGVEGYLLEGDDLKGRSYHIILLAKDETGLRNLYKLVSDSHIHHFYRRPNIPRALLDAHREGLIVGSACEAGELYQAILNGAPQARLAQIAGYYDYLEIQPIGNNLFLVDEGKADEERLRDINRRIVALGREHARPVIATCDVHYLNPEDEIYRRIIMASHGFADTERTTPVFLRTTDEMLAEFAYLGEEVAREVVIAGPRRIACAIKPMAPVPEGNHPPKFEGADDELCEMTLREAARLYGDPLPSAVAERLERELDSIVGNGYATLYLIAQKLVRRSLDDGYLVGSRGSVGSSLVATVCGISEVNPLPPHYLCQSCRHLEWVAPEIAECGPDLEPKDCPNCRTPLAREGFDIPFETFLGFHGDKVPDIDLNFSGEYQPRAHQFAEALFGPENIFRAGTVGRLADRTAYGYVAKYLEEKGVQARQAEINRLVRGCAGVRKTTGQHPGGLVVVPDGHEVYEFTPIQHPANKSDGGTITTHFDFDSLHDSLVKLDILGHDAPTVIKMLEDMTGVRTAEIRLDDQPTMALFSGLESLGIDASAAGGEVGTLGVPEFGTGFVRQVLVDTRPATFADLVRIMGLVHGTDLWFNNAQDLIRAGTCTLAQVIAARDDIMLYLIQKGLDKGMAFKIMESVRKGKGLTPEWEQAMREAAVPNWYIDSCKKIKYLFPKAHGVAYAIMMFYIAYYKVRYPSAFYAAYFSTKAEEADGSILVGGAGEIAPALQAIARKGNDASAKEKSVYTVLEVANEACARGISFASVDVYRSDVARFTLAGENVLLCPLVSLPGLGETAAEAIVRERGERPFTSMEDLRKRAGLSKTVIEALAEHGALAGWPETDQLSLF